MLNIKKRKRILSPFVTLEEVILNQFVKYPQMLLMLLDIYVS